MEATDSLWRPLKGKAHRRFLLPKWCWHLSRCWDSSIKCVYSFHTFTVFDVALHQVPLRRGALHCLQVVWSHLPCSGTTALPNTAHQICMPKTVNILIYKRFKSHLTFINIGLRCVPRCPCPGYYHRSRDACWRQQEDNPVWHRHDQMHLLRLLSRGMSCGRYCRGLWTLST